MQTKILLLILLFARMGILGAQPSSLNNTQPNFVIIYSDDQRYDAQSCTFDNKTITPNLDKLCARGMYFENAFVTLSICSPSRAALLTGRYGRANGVTTFGKTPLNKGQKTFAQVLHDEGYQTGMVGKWHLGDPPGSLGFDHSSYFFSNGPWYGRTVIEEGTKKVSKGFIEDYNAERAIDFLEGTKKDSRPYLLFYCPQLPHLDNNFNWDVTEDALALYDNTEIELPQNWSDEELTGKPPYLLEGRHRQKALSYGYANADTLRYQIKRYYAAITEMDAAMGRVLDKIQQLPHSENTYIIFMSDNGWFIGDHLFTSKVLAYEESMRVPLVIAGPGIQEGRNRDLVMNIDVYPTLLDIIGERIPSNLHGKSLLKPLKGQSWPEKRNNIYYEAPTPQLGSHPLAAVRTDRYKYIETYESEELNNVVFRELYDLRNDPYEMHNMASVEDKQGIINFLSKKLNKEKNQYQ